MDSTSSRTEILQQIRLALREKTSVVETWADEENFFAEENGPDVEIFERSFTRLQGHILRCESLTEIPHRLKQLPQALLEKTWCCTATEYLPFVQQAGVSTTDNGMMAEVLVTDCECLVARTGTVVLSAAQSSGRALPVYAPVHITIAKESQLLYDTENAIDFLLKKYDQQLPSSLHFVAGPSRTGDIEKTLVMGVHGPGEVFVLLVKE
ncbi:MAG: LutC/YkgG family protein [Agriterribacter sp.]